MGAARRSVTAVSKLKNLGWEPFAGSNGIISGCSVWTDGLHLDPREVDLNPNALPGANTV